MVHTQEIKPVSDQHLLRRQGVYYYRRRVPLSLVEKIGKKVIQHSLETTNVKEAKKRRTMYDLHWDARFEAYAISGPDDKALMQTSAQNSSLSAAELTQLVRNYVERQDQAAKKRDASCHPVTASERREMRTEAEFEAQTLQARDDLHHQWIFRAGAEALKAAGKSFNDHDVAGETLAELVRRGLLELNRRHRARLADDHGRSFFDQLFDPARPAMLTFGKLAEQHLRLIEEDGAINALGAKGLDRQRATIALVREIVGDDTPVDAVDYDTCLHVRTILARLPANRTKLYGDLALAQAIERAAKDGKPLLSPVTQDRYLVALRDLLDLAAKKRLIPINPAEGLRPIKRDTISSGDKRKPFTLQQIADFFKSQYYAESAKHSPPFAHDKAAWRFWLPPMCLFLGMRPNEAAQLHLHDLKRTKAGTWYLHIIATADDDEGTDTATGKTLKTKASRRKIISSITGRSAMSGETSRAGSGHDAIP